MKRGWFGPRSFGWGAAPASWQGWVTTAVFILAMGATAFAGPDNSAAVWIARGVVLAAYLAVIALTWRRDARTSR